MARTAQNTAVRSPDAYDVRVRVRSRPTVVASGAQRSGRY